MRRQPKVYHLTGTGAAISVDVGFEPYRVEVFNETQICRALHIRGMDAASAHKVSDNGAGTADSEYITSGGITLGSRGFSIGTDADLNTASDVIHVYVD